MRVVIAGGHGQIARLLIARLAAAGDEGVALIRDPAHSEDVRADGGTSVVFDLEQEGADALVPHLEGADAVVFAAGAGPGSGAERKLTVDLGGAVKLIEAAQQTGVERYVMVSAIGADRHDPDSDDVFQIYLRAKSEADRALRDSGLAWTVIRPGPLTDSPPTGRVATNVGRADIPRADVAATIEACLRDPRTIGTQFDLVGGDIPIADAVAAQ